MIYYSHINEDNRIERQLLCESACATAVVICGSGERVISLMDIDHCKRFIVVDNNDEAIYLLQLKLTALTHLSVHDYLSFIGHYPLPEKERWAMFEAIKQHLPALALKFWNNHSNTIARSLLQAGQFEKFLGRVRSLTRWYLGRGFRHIWTKDFDRAIFPEKRWGLLKTLFAHKIVYRLAGNKDVAFTGKKADTRLIPSALDGIIKSNKAPASFMAHLVFNGNLLQMPEATLPPSLQKQVLTRVKERLIKKEITVATHVDDLLHFVTNQSQTIRQPAFYSVSDLLSFVPFEYVKELAGETTTEGNIVIGRSFLRNRLTKDHLHQLTEFGQVTLYDEQDSTGMYQVFCIKPPATV
jgi:S-adenosylmethionine:diacylglycerol 3-amino-3-carboxypropyl transferase